MLLTPRFLKSVFLRLKKDLVKWGAWIGVCYLFLSFFGSQIARTIGSVPSFTNKIREGYSVMMEVDRDMADVVPPGKELPFRNPQADSSNCEVIHIAMICAGSTITREYSQMLKTVLYHRHNPLILHFLADQDAILILSKLFETWELPKVSVNLYSIDTLKPSTLSTNYLYLKMTLFRHIPEEIEKVLYIDYSMRFSEDISILWQYFNNFNDEQMIGLVNNPTTNPTKQKDNLLYDVILQRLDMLRESDFYRITSINADVVNTLLAEKRNIIYSIPCPWSVELVRGFNLETCIGNDEVKGMRWGRLSAGFHPQPQLDKAIEYVTEILESNGELFRTATICGVTRQHSHTQHQVAVKNLGVKCAEYIEASKMKRRLHLYYYGDRSYVPKGEYDVTLLTQMTVDRFGNFEQFMRNWDGPTVAVVHGTDSDAQKLLKKIALSKLVNRRRDISFHFVYKRKYYPINYLRNVAVNQTMTPYLLFVDVDLVPTPGLYNLLTTQIIPTEMEPKTALVLPSFEAFMPLDPFPENKNELLTLMNQDKVDGYRMRKKWKLGHVWTNYPKWKVATEPYIVKYRDAFEPYIVLPTKEAPLYQEQLLERMGDKISYGVHIYSLGYAFKILHDVYIVHLPHPKSEGTMVWGSQPSYLGCGAYLMKQFKLEMKALREKLAAQQR